MNTIIVLKIYLIDKIDKEGIESQDRNQQESLKGRITLPASNKPIPDNVSITEKKFNRN